MPVICITEFSTCLNIVLRGNTVAEEELVSQEEEEVLDFICFCATTAVVVIIPGLDVEVSISI